MSSEYAHFGFKKITNATWLSADLPKLFSELTEDLWLSSVLKPTLSDGVPREIKGMFEVARGIMIYGWFFYPLLTIGAEQCLRVLEAGAKSRCQQLGLTVERKRRSGSGPIALYNYIDTLGNNGELSSDDVAQWKLLRSLRNHVSHPSHQDILPPAIPMHMLQNTAEVLNRLFCGHVDSVQSKH